MHLFTFYCLIQKKMYICTITTISNYTLIKNQPYERNKKTRSIIR